MGKRHPRRYCGFAQVCLLHQEALVSTETTTPAARAYRLGEADSDIHITDFRSSGPLAPPTVFDPPAGPRRQPGYLVIQQTDAFLDIQIFDAPAQDDAPTLWLGFMDKNRPPARQVQWEALELAPRGPGYRIAYAAFGR